MRRSPHPDLASAPSLSHQRWRMAACLLRHPSAEPTPYPPIRVSDSTGVRSCDGRWPMHTPSIATLSPSSWRCARTLPRGVSPESGRPSRWPGFLAQPHLRGAVRTASPNHPTSPRRCPPTFDSSALTGSWQPDRTHPLHSDSPLQTRGPADSGVGRDIPRRSWLRFCRSAEDRASGRDPRISGDRRTRASPTAGRRRRFAASRDPCR